jgi:hypothetical protein
MNSVPASASRLAVLVVDVIDTSRQALAQRQRRIHDNIPGAVVTVDDAGTIVDARLDGCRTFGTGEPSCLQGSRGDAVLGANLAMLRAGNDLTLRRADSSEVPARIGIWPGSSWRGEPRCRPASLCRDTGETGTRTAVAK